MRDVKDVPRPMGRTEQNSSVDGPSGKVGWDVAVLVIVGAALALVGIALLIVGSLMH
jgi:hypothetical protein